MSVISASILKKMTHTLGGLLLMSAFPGDAASLNMEFKARLVAETCTFAATSKTFAFGNVYPQEILQETKFVTQDIAVSSCTGSPQNMQFYLTPITGTGHYTSDRSILVPMNKSYGIETTLSILNAANQQEGNSIFLHFDPVSAVSITNQSMVGKKIRLTAGLVPVPGKTSGADFEVGAFSAVATLNIVYF
ncbi:hypothetical protein C2125_11035 [Rahnella aquatilis]|nr:fimbrial protein [Rahnella aquatilis]RBQ34281.1 hypothetical protein C2125_11035 [Rahnella aquatilis]